MAWNDLATNQMVSYTDAQGGGFTLNAGQSSVTSDQCMTKTDALAKYSLNATNMSTYGALQLVPKSAWVNGVAGPVYTYQGPINAVAGATSVNITLPVTVAVGDLLVLAVIMQTTATPSTLTATGWTLQNSERQNGGSSFIYTRIATSSAESGTTLSVSFTVPGGSVQIVGGQIYRYTGNKTTSPVSYVGLNSSSTATSVASTFGVGSATNSALAVVISMALGSTQTVAYSYTIPSGWTYDDTRPYTAGVYGIRLGTTSKSIPTAGTNPGTITATMALSGHSAHYYFYIYSI